MNGAVLDAWLQMSCTTTKAWKDRHDTSSRRQSPARLNGYTRRVFFLQQLPLAGTNKIDKERLRAWVENGTLV